MQSMEFKADDTGDFWVSQTKKIKAMTLWWEEANNSRHHTNDGAELLKHQKKIEY